MGGPEDASSGCFTKETVLLPTAVRVNGRPRVDSDLISEPSDDAAGYLYCQLLNCNETRGNAIPPPHIYN